MMNYSFYKRDDELLLVIPPQPEAPDGPMLIYDGGDTALLFRDWGSNIRLRAIGNIVRPLLKAAKEIRVRETDGGEVLRDYTARVRIVRDVKSMMM